MKSKRKGTVDEHRHEPKMRPIEFSNGDLTQSSSIEYNVHNVSKIEGNVFKMNIVMQLPAFLTTVVWLRHNYTLRDVALTLNSFQSVNLWQCALLFGITGASSTIKITFATDAAMVFGAKSIVVCKIMKYLTETGEYEKNTKHVLNNKSDHHVPPIPLHELNDKEWTFLNELLHSERFSLQKTVVFKNVFTWKDIQLVPIRIEEGAIFAQRVIKSETFYKSKRSKQRSIHLRLLKVQVGEEKYIGVEESCLFQKVKTKR